MAAAVSGLPRLCQLAFAAALLEGAPNSFDGCRFEEDFRLLKIIFVFSPLGFEGSLSLLKIVVYCQLPQKWLPLLTHCFFGVSFVFPLTRQNIVFAGVLIPAKQKGGSEK